MCLPSVVRHIFSCLENQSNCINYRKDQSTTQWSIFDMNWIPWKPRRLSRNHFMIDPFWNHRQQNTTYSLNEANPYMLHKLLADDTKIFWQSSTEHHHLFLLWCHFENFLDISSHVLKRNHLLFDDTIHINLYNTRWGHN